MIGRALVTHADSRFGRWAAEALVPLAGEIVTMSGGGNALDWEAIESGFDVIVHAPPALESATAETVMLSAWLALKHSHRLMAAAGGGTLVTLCPRGDDQPELEAALYGHRLSATAALLDAIKIDLRPRANRLVFDPAVREDQFKAALALLADERSVFMTGTELTLASRPDHPAATARLDGKTILVTGATSGIGRATAIEIGRQRGFVAVGGRKLDLAEETLTMVRDAGGDGMVASLDVTDEAAWARACEAIVDARGALDGLVNNAGESRNRPIADLAAEDLNFLLGINYRGTLLGMRQCLAPIAARGGAILNISSVAGIRAAPGGSAYGGSKASVVGLSLAWAAAHRDTAIRINAVQPGLIWSDSVADSLGEEGARNFRAWIEPKTPIGRVGVPEDVAQPVAFLLSDAAAAISGQAISVSGGLEHNIP
jgi:NAD(P)-dependent dehydrogenase (short-subunit alcohol dehydrogenase family)